MRTSLEPQPGRPPKRSRSVHLFPGQGDFSVTSLTRAVHAEEHVREAVRLVFREVDPVAEERGLPPLGRWLLSSDPPSGRELADAPAGTAQLALFGASVAVHRALCVAKGPPHAVVGVSFGEIAALTAAGVLGAADGARAAHELSLVLASCLGGLTLLSCSASSALQLLDRAEARDAVVAVVNDDRSVVVSGPLPDLLRTEKTATEAGVAAVRLHLPFSSHHPSLVAQADAFTASLRTLSWCEARLPVYSAVAGRRYLPEDDLTRRLADCLVRPAVVPAVLAMAAAAHRPDVLFEAGTGRALACSAHRTLSAATGPHVHAPLAEPDFVW